MNRVIISQEISMIIGPHRGPVPYKIEQVAPTVWRWSASIPKDRVDRQATGLAYSRRAAVRAAKSLIDQTVPVERSKMK
jgi:hypothetical protein